MSERQTEYLRPCPFCGGEPVLNVTDNNSYNGTVVTEIRCKKCYSGGRTTVSYNHSVTVGSEAHNDIVKEVIRTWNSRVEIPKNTKQLTDICDTLLELSVSLESGLTVVQNLIQNYFGNIKKKHEESDGKWLLYYYDEARVFSRITRDYIYEALQMTNNLTDSIEL